MMCRQSWGGCWGKRSISFCKGQKPPDTGELPMTNFTSFHFGLLPGPLKRPNSTDDNDQPSKRRRSGELVPDEDPPLPARCEWSFLLRALRAQAHGFVALRLSVVTDRRTHPRIIWLFLFGRVGEVRRQEPRPSGLPPGTYPSPSSPSSAPLRQDYSLADVSVSSITTIMTSVLQQNHQRFFQVDKRQRASPAKGAN